MTDRSGATSGTRRVAIVGASFAGLFAAAAAVAGGHEVILVERDELPDDPGPTAAPRRGVPQGRQPHVLLHRGMMAMETLLPGLDRDLAAAGARELDTGQLPWLSPYGWMPTDRSSYAIHSLSRPLLELVVRRRVLALPGVTLRSGVRVDGLEAGPDGSPPWVVRLADGGRIPADVVLDASGRTSRLPQWLVELGCPEPATERVEAHLGYASRRYRSTGVGALPTGVVMLATPEKPWGALALPVEDDHWLVLENGYGEHRPDRDEASFETFLHTLPDPALAELVAGLRPEGDVAIYRQTGNQRRGYAEHGRWPTGVLAVGDSLCAFNPIYGQGITVAACQAELLVDAIGRLGTEAATKRWQGRLAAVTAFPWSISTGEDQRYVGEIRTRLPERAVAGLVGRWTERMSWLAVGGDAACLDAFGSAYHLMGSPRQFFGPKVVLAVVRSLLRGVPTPAPRPPVLDRLRVDHAGS